MTSWVESSSGLMGVPEKRQAPMVLIAPHQGLLLHEEQGREAAAVGPPLQRQDLNADGQAPGIKRSVKPGNVAGSAAQQDEHRLAQHPLGVRRFQPLDGAEAFPRIKAQEQVYHLQHVARALAKVRPDGGMGGGAHGRRHRRVLLARQAQARSVGANCALEGRDELKDARASADKRGHVGFQVPRGRGCAGESHHFRHHQGMDACPQRLEVAELAKDRALTDARMPRNFLHRGEAALGAHKLVDGLRDHRLRARAALGPAVRRLASSNPHGVGSLE